MRQHLGVWPFDLFDTPGYDIPDPAQQKPETAEEASFWRKVSEFKARVAEFWDVFGRLQRLQPIAEQDPRARAEYSRLMGSASKITDKISEVTNTVKSLVGWVGGLFGLGALPFVPIAVVVGAVTLITAWLVDAKVQLTELESVE